MTGPWRNRARVAEAAVLLIAARLLIGVTPFGRWRGWLGDPVPASPLCSAPLPPMLALRARRAGRAAERAATHMGGRFKCLPRAMAVHWMLARRQIPSVLVFGVSGKPARGTIDELHAWVSAGEEIIIGALEQYHAPLLALRSRIGCPGRR